MLIGRKKSRLTSIKNHSVVNLTLGIEHIRTEYSEIPVTIYKIRLPTVVTCWIGISTDTDPERIKNEAFHRAIEDESIKTYPERIKAALRKAIEDEGIKSAAFEIVDTVDGATAARRVKQEIEKHKNWAVFNRQAPLQARESNKRRIEVFCEYFDVSYDEVLEKTQKFKDLMEKFNSLKDDIEKVKRQVDKRKSLFEPDKIQDPILRALAKRYEEKKSQTDAIDFLDMLIYSAYLLETNQDILCEYRDTYRYVFVDEFQDISPVDFRLISLFSENLFAVGDDDQAIYGFRGGDSSIMQERFGKQKHVANYEITCNYRSTSSIVKHARSLIVYNNSDRFSKNLRAENSAQSRVDVLNTSPDTIKNILLSELISVVTVCETHFKENTPHLDNLLLQELTVPQEIGILVRNWYEVKKIQQTLLGSELRTQGFKNDWSEADDAGKRKMLLRRGTKEIEVSTIHSAKGREWEKVILLVNTVKNRSGSLYVSLPDSRNDLTDERRVFYVAITRTKQELVILGGNCQFISEFQNVHPIEIVETLESQIKKELEEVSKKALETFKSKLKQELEEGITAALKQSNELNGLQNNIAEAKKAAEQIGIDLPKQLKAANEALLEGLIPVLDEFESQIKSLSVTFETNNHSADIAEPTKSFQLAHKQLLDSLKTHGLKPIKTVGEIFDPDSHEEILPAIYSDEVQADCVAREERRGYLLRDQIIRKSQVVVSKGENIRIPEQLDRIVEIYLDRLINFKFGPKYGLDKPAIRQKMAKHLVELDEESIKKINSAATIDPIRYINEQPLGNYCVGRSTTYMCTDVVFRDFWKYMWEVVEQSRKTPKPKIEPGPSSADKLTLAAKTQRITSVESSKKIADTSLKRFIDGEIVKGIVINVTCDKVMIDIGFKSESYIPASEFDTGENALLAVQIGDEIDVYIVRREDAEGQIVLSKKIVDQTLMWDKIATAHETNTPIKGRITERIKGGLRVTIGSLRGFLPASQVELRPIQNLEQYVGQTLDMMVISLSKRQHNIVLSRCACLEAELAQKRSQVLSTLGVGQHIEGVVKNITAFGAFVDLGGVDGLIHKSELSWKRIHHPSEIVSVGEEIKIKVIKFNRENEKISLSLKQMTSDPWENVEEKYPVGSTIQGIIINIVDYGAFFEIEEGVEGLIHASEMSLTQQNMEPSHIVNKGDEVEARVLEISKDSRRISLSIKQCQQNPFETETIEPFPDIPHAVMEIGRDTSSEPAKPPISKPTEVTEELPIITEADNNSYLDKPRDSIGTESVEEAVDTPPPMSEKISAVLNLQIQKLKPETLETQISSESLETVNDNSHSIPQEPNDILKIHIEAIKPALPAENADPPMEINSNIADQLTESIFPESVDNTNDSPPNIEISHEEELPRDEVQGGQRNLEHYLRKLGRFVVRKLKQE